MCLWNLSGIYPSGGIVCKSNFFGCCMGDFCDWKANGSYRKTGEKRTGVSSVPAISIRECIGGDKMVILNRGKIRKRKLRASFSVEAAVIGCVIMFSLAGFMQSAIYLYSDSVQKSRQEVKMGQMTPAQVLRLKRIGGSLYEQFRTENTVQEEDE